MELAKIENYKMIKLDDLVHAEWNYKQNSEEMAFKLVANMKRNGQIENLLVRKLKGGKYEVVNGNHRMDALKQIGCTRAVCYDLGDIDDQEAYRISIETNETKFAVDQVQLAKLIADITKAVPVEELLASFPYNQEEIDNYLKMNTFDWNQMEVTGDESKGEEDQQGKVISFQCEPPLVEAWEEWKHRCRTLHPELITDESLFLQAIKAALDHTETD